MKSSTLILSAICLIFIVLNGKTNAQKQYTNKFDNVNVDSVLGNGRVLQNYIKCLLEQGPCTSEGRELKKLLPDALASDCSKCTATQRKNSSKVINFLRTNKAKEWNQLLTKYDPTGNYQKQHARELAAGRR